MRKTILITGASGLVATELSHLLLSDGSQYKVYALTTSPEKLKSRYMGQEDVVCLSIAELDNFATVHFDAVVHCAFARDKDSQKIAESLHFTEKVLRKTREFRPGVFVNISSQSVYGQSTPPLWTEETPPAPDYLYALGKYSSELLTSAYLRDSGIRYTNIRLSSVCENARFMNVFVKNALSGKPICVQGGTQQCSFIDVRDVASALKRVIDKASEVTLAPVYNLGTGKTRTILELAKDIKLIAETERGLQVTIDIQSSDLRLAVGMDSSLFCGTFGWGARYDYDDMIRSLFALNDESRGGGDAALIPHRVQ